MNPEIVDELEEEIERAISEALKRIGRKKLPVRPTGKMVHLMAKSAVTVYEAVVENHRDQDE